MKNMNAFTGYAVLKGFSICVSELRKARARWNVLYRNLQGRLTVGDFSKIYISREFKNEQIKNIRGFLGELEDIV